MTGPWFPKPGLILLLGTPPVFPVEPGSGWMQKDAPKKSREEWAAIYHDLGNQIAKRIELFASHAEAVNCRARGNITRRTGDVPPHQLYIDLCIHDMDYLRQFVIDYSRGKIRT